VKRLLPLVAVAGLVVIAVATGLSAARGPNPNAVPSAQEVDNRTMSPFCVGLTLAACPSSEALRLRATIAGMVSAGKTNREIDSFLLANYPKTVIGAPRNLMAWAVPAAAVLAGLLVVVVVVFRKWGGSGDPGSGQPGEPLPPIPPNDSARLAADLRRFAQGTSE
jgi:cytochrome c-type biogenesis protein CcmH/NrfF